MTMIEAMGDALRSMAEVLGGSRKKVDEPLIRAYLWVIEDDALAPEDVTAASKHLCKDGEGVFPPGPVFRRECLRQKHRRQTREANDAFRERQESRSDLYADEYEEPFSKEDARAMIEATLNKLSGKFGAWPGEEPPRDMKKEIRRLRETAA